jgi:16S rRNA (uracil1498-N3)-methyltransferase
MVPRLYLALPLHAGLHLTLPEGPSRHAQVLRLQPGSVLVLFNGQGGQWQATVVEMGRKAVQVLVGAHEAQDPTELGRHTTLALGVPANERMDFVVEKATELGVAAIVPLLCERSVLRLSGERALKKQAHWQAVAISACEQSGRTRVPQVLPVVSLSAWLAGLDRPCRAGEQRVLLSTQAAAPALGLVAEQTTHWVSLSGPEGGLSSAEMQAAQQAGFVPASLGARVLRADTAPLVVLARWG